MAVVDNDIRGKLALITGASGGIGAACARALWARGTSLALTFSTNKDSLDRLVAELHAAHGTNNADGSISTHHVDVTSEEDITRLFAEIRSQHGRDGPDILISNAGYGKRTPNIADIVSAEFDHTMSVNLRASFLLCRLAIPAMVGRRWGRVVFISSIAAHGGGINGCHYAASKAALTGLMRSLAVRHARDGITVNDVAPAMIGGTGMIPDEKTVEGTAGDVRNIPVGRLGTTEEVANVVDMICRTGYLTGQSILLSGGLK